MANSTTTQKLCNWFIQQSNARGHVLTPVKLNHLVILADWWHLHRTGGFLINERVEAWPSGPVLPSIYHEYKDQPPYSSIEHPSRRQPPFGGGNGHHSLSGTYLELLWQIYGPAARTHQHRPFLPMAAGPGQARTGAPPANHRGTCAGVLSKPGRIIPEKNSLPLPCTAFFQSKHIFE